MRSPSGIPVMCHTGLLITNLLLLCRASCDALVNSTTLSTFADTYWDPTNGYIPIKQMSREDCGQHCMEKNNKNHLTPCSGIQIGGEWVKKIMWQEKKVYHVARKFCGSFILRIGHFLWFTGTNFCGSGRLKFLLGTNFYNSLFKQQNI